LDLLAKAYQAVSHIPISPNENMPISTTRKRKLAEALHNIRNGNDTCFNIPISTGPMPAMKLAVAPQRHLIKKLTESMKIMQSQIDFMERMLTLADE
jgi:hypothetical protein